MLKEPVYCVDSWILDVFRDVREASFCESLNWTEYFLFHSPLKIYIYIYFNLVVYDIFFYINSKFFFFFYFMLERNNINN